MKRFFSQVFSIVCIILIVYAFISIRPYRVSGDSMDPTLQPNEIILIDRFSPKFFPLKRGEIIVYSDVQSEEKIKIKRILGLPSEDLEIANGKLSLTGQEIQETYLGEHIRTCVPGSCVDLSSKIYEIPNESYFVLGDYRENSVDSRGCSDATKCSVDQVQYIPEREIIGRMILKF